MSGLIHYFIEKQAASTPHAPALIYKKATFTYSELTLHVSQTAAGFIALGLQPSERIATYLPKLPETVCSIFGAAKAGGVFVPVNPLLKPNQVSYILKDCNVRILVTSSDRLRLLSDALAGCHDLRAIILVDNKRASIQKLHAIETLNWDQLTESSTNCKYHRRIDNDMAAILYTSGSTGSPKGVVLSHRNMVAGAKSVAQYLENKPEDKLLAVLPFSFDYGLSQLTTAFSVGASVVLMDYLLPRDVVKAVAHHQITGLAAVPPLWNQLTQLEWPEEAVKSLRYMTNSGGAMPKATLNSLRTALPNSQFYLMYGLTEAFRSTYLPPEEIDNRPDSMGKAIPNVEVMVVREDGSHCLPGEPGELVHRGSLVSLGYWNAPEKTAKIFKPTPGQDNALTMPEIAVWSGDRVKMDEEGFLYFVGRKDDMIKTSGYRISPTEIEEAIYSSKLVSEAVALGIPHPTLGQGILVIVTSETPLNNDAIITHCKKELPNFMVPHAIEHADSLPRNPNGKIDRKLLASKYQDIFS
ncbi:MAG: acyl-CoA ligase (AMP-forming), exosortase A system-associated [Candidatus Polarisedimenticolaceae bacterium]|nr:acyl-CoA ligase (AMP-forming), exosortase A system-associated [Candidatus Polarisedimenticolaceae bacterium]